MSSSAMRGAVLVALAALLGYLVLLGVPDLSADEVQPVAAGDAPLPTVTPLPDGSDPGAVPLATPTVVASAVIWGPP